MTCIVGIVHDGRVTIGGDSAGSDGRLVSNRADTKVFRRGPYLMGFTSSYRMGQLLRYAGGNIPEPGGWDVDRFMATDFIDWTRQTLKDGGFAGVSDDIGGDKGGTFLVGIYGRLYQIEDDFQIGVPADGYDACGSGYLVALGSLHSTRDLIADPAERIRRALEASAYLTSAVRPPFTTVSAA